MRVTTSGAFESIGVGIDNRTLRRDRPRFNYPRSLRSYPIADAPIGKPKLEHGVLLWENSMNESEASRVTKSHLWGIASV